MRGRLHEGVRIKYSLTARIVISTGEVKRIKGFASNEPRISPLKRRMKRVVMPHPGHNHPVNILKGHGIPIPVYLTHIP